MGLPGQAVPAGCWLGCPVAIAIGEAILDGVETALVPCRGRPQGAAFTQGKAQGREGTVPTVLFTTPFLSCPGMVGMTERREPPGWKGAKVRGPSSQVCPARGGVWGVRFMRLCLAPVIRGT